MYYFKNMVYYLNKNGYNRDFLANGFMKVSSNQKQHPKSLLNKYVDGDDRQE